MYIRVEQLKRLFFVVQKHQFQKGKYWSSIAVNVFGMKTYYVAYKLLVIINVWHQTIYNEKIIVLLKFEFGS